MWKPKGLSEDRERFMERCAQKHDAQKRDAQSGHNWPFSVTKGRVYSLDDVFLS